MARSKSRNLLERLRDFENDTLRFMDDKIAPFSNNQAENDLRMTMAFRHDGASFISSHRSTDMNIKQWFRDIDDALEDESIQDSLSDELFQSDKLYKWVDWAWQYSGGVVSFNFYPENAFTNAR